MILQNISRRVVGSVLIHIKSGTSFDFTKYLKRVVGNVLINIHIKSGTSFDFTKYFKESCW